jgi:hypothetical protein
MFSTMARRTRRFSPLWAFHLALEVVGHFFLVAILAKKQRRTVVPSLAAGARGSC